MGNFYKYSEFLLEYGIVIHIGNVYMKKMQSARYVKLRFLRVNNFLTTHAHKFVDKKRIIRFLLKCPFLKLLLLSKFFTFLVINP